MIEAGLAAAGRDREVHARIIEHPLGIIRFDDGRLGGEQRRVEADGLRDVVDGDMNMKALHGGFLSGLAFRLEPFFRLVLWRAFAQACTPSRPRMERRRSNSRSESQAVNS